MRQSIFILPDTYLCIHTAIPHTSGFYLYGGKIHLAPTSLVSLGSARPAWGLLRQQEKVAEQLPFVSLDPIVLTASRWPPCQPTFSHLQLHQCSPGFSIPASLLTLEHPRHFPSLEISHWLFPLPGTLFPQTACFNAPSPVTPSLGCYCQQLPPPLVPAPHPAPASPLSVDLATHPSFPPLTLPHPLPFP